MNAIEVEVQKNIKSMSLEAYQLKYIKKTINYAKENAPFYKELLEGSPEISTLKDLEKLPFTTHEDLRNKPYKLLCVSLTGVARIFSHFTTGTLGRPKKIFFSEKDVARITRSMAAITENVIKGVGLETTESKVGVYLPNQGRPLSMAEMIARGTLLIGGNPYIGSCKETTENQIDEILTERPQVLMGSAFRIWRISQVGRENHDLKKVGVKALFITSEYLSSTMRKRLEDIWGAEVFHHYGMTEPGFAIAIECGCHNGFHYNESDLYFEVINPETGTVVGDGEVGELVFTSLHREAMPLIRYRTGDIASITKVKCDCGTRLSRIGIMPKKIGLIYQIESGEDIYASLFDEALYELDDLIDYRIWLSNEQGVDHLHCKVEIIGSDLSFEENTIKQLLSIPVISEAISMGKMSLPTIEIAPRETLRRGGVGMKKKIVDERSIDPYDEVKKRYGAHARGEKTEKNKSILDAEGRTDLDRVGYTEDEIKIIPKASDMGLGCGTPLSFLSLKKGETVLDLGSGGGIDCFLASNKVGASGRVIGVDLTPEMVEKAKLNAIQDGYSNIEFILGSIENLPLPDNSVDAIISNCVLNLVLDKDSAFKESARVLKESGRISISDIVTVGKVSPNLKKLPKAYTACLSGAIPKEAYLSLLAEAGFKNISIEKEKEWPFFGNFVSLQVTAWLQ